MEPTRRSQPHRRGAREPSSVLAAMLEGGTAFGMNPADHDRLRRKIAEIAALQSRLGMQLTAIREAGRGSRRRNQRAPGRA